MDMLVCGKEGELRPEGVHPINTQSSDEAACPSHGAKKHFCKGFYTPARLLEARNLEIIDTTITYGRRDHSSAVRMAPLAALARMVASWFISMGLVR